MISKKQLDLRITDLEAKVMLLEEELNKKKGVSKRAAKVKVSK